MKDGWREEIFRKRKRGGGVRMEEKNACMYVCEGKRAALMRKGVRRVKKSAMK